VALDPGRGDGSSHNGTAHVAFSSSDGLGPCDFKDFVAHSHTPSDHCVRFVMVVTFHDATLVTGRALPLSRTGLSPAGPRQLRLAHHYAFTVSDSHPLLLAGLPAHIAFVPIFHRHRAASMGIMPEIALNPGRSSMFRCGKSNPDPPGSVIVKKKNPGLLEG
jgi:hypothetical protein